MLPFVHRTKPITYHRYPKPHSLRLLPRMINQSSVKLWRELAKTSSLFIIFRSVDPASPPPFCFHDSRKNSIFPSCFSSRPPSRRWGNESTGKKRGAKEGRKRKKKERKEERKKKKKERKNGRPRGPVRPRKWKRRREMAVSIIPETMTDRHRYSAGNPRASATKMGTLLHLESIYQRTRRPWASSTRDSNFFRVYIRIVAAR